MTVSTFAVDTAGVRAFVPYGDLLAALATVSTVLARRSRPPWNTVLISGDDDGTLTLTGASPDATVTVRLPGAARTPGRFGVDGWALTRLCKALAHGDRRRDTARLPVALDGADPAAPTISLGDYTIPLAGLPAQDHPGDCEPAPTIASVDRAALRTAVDRVLPALGRDATAPILTGVHLSLAPGRLTLAATDRYRLAVDSLPAVGGDPAAPQTMVLPGRILAACAPTWTEPRVTIGRRRAAPRGDLDRVTLTCGQSTVSLVETAGVFPPWHKLLTFPTRYSAVIDRATLHAHVSRVLAILAAHPAVRGSIGVMTVTLTPGGMRVAPQIPDHTERVHAPTLPAVTSGVEETIRWAVNAAYLRDALASLPGNTVLFCGQQDVNRGVQLTSPDGEPADIAPYRHIVMTIRQD